MTWPVGPRPASPFAKPPIPAILDGLDRWLLRDGRPLADCRALAADLQRRLGELEEALARAGQTPRWHPDGPVPQFEPTDFQRNADVQKAVTCAVELKREANALHAAARKVAEHVGLAGGLYDDEIRGSGNSGRQRPRANEP